ETRRMPKVTSRKPRLKAEEIKKIREWIAAGAPKLPAPASIDVVLGPPPSPPPTVADGPAGLAAEVKAIFQSHCAKCHGDGPRFKGELNLWKTDSIKKVVVAGKPDESAMLKRILDKDDPMPPADSKINPLTEKEV